MPGKTTNKYRAYQETRSYERQQADAVRQLDAAFATYLNTRRDALIMELRLIESLLGLEQSIPRRQR